MKKKKRAEKTSSRAKAKPRKPRKRLLYNISPANDGLVFAEYDRALFISRIHDAFGSCTWKDFRHAMPKQEYSYVVQMCFDDDGIRRPSGSDRFDPGQVPAYCSGDYPPWLQAEMHLVLPEEILEEFARGEATMLSGSYDHIDPKHLPKIKTRLEALGYTVEDGRHLSFF